MAALNLLSHAWFWWGSVWGWGLKEPSSVFPIEPELCLHPQILGRLNT